MEAVIREIKDEFGSAVYGVQAMADFMGRHGELKAVAAKLEGRRCAGAVEFAGQLALSQVPERRKAVSAWLPPARTRLTLTGPEAKIPATKNLILAVLASREDAMSKRRQSSDSSRRNFLKGAGLVGAAAAVVPPVAANAVPAAPPPQLKAALPGPAANRGRDAGAGERSGQSDLERRRLHGGRAQFARHRISGDQLRLELSRPARSRHQSRATTSPRSSPACTRTSRSTWRRAMPRSRASRWRWPATASSACSTPPWRCTTLGATACRCWSSAAISWRRTSARPAPNGCIPASTSARSSASSPNGTTSRRR